MTLTNFEIQHKINNSKIQPINNCNSLSDTVNLNADKKLAIDPFTKLE